MASEDELEPVPAGRLGAGQTAIRPAATALALAEQVRELQQLSDPALSELDLEELLIELLGRVQRTLSVDTVAILLYDQTANELVARAAKGIEEEVEQGVRLPIGQGFAGRIAAERVPIFIEDVDHADILNPILREKRIQSLLGVPMVIEGGLIGVLHVGSLHTRTFTEHDVAVLQLAAARAAAAIEHARLSQALEREHRVAMLLQRSLLPKRLPQPIGVRVTGRYLPARAEVGGDWYDVIELPGGRIGIAIGDVVGHGLDAAALMGQLRTALHAYAIEGHGPAKTLGLVDRFLQESRDDAMATAAYAIFDIGTGRLTLASAGHLPPLLIRAGGCTPLPVVPAAPLGVLSYGACQEHEIVLAEGEMVILYTDGLVERRGVPIDDGIALLAQTVCEATSPDDVCERAVRAMVPPEGLRDDVAVIALHNEPVPAELHLTRLAKHDVLHEVRMGMRRWLRDRGATPGETNDIVLSVAEACANVVRHAADPGRAVRFTLVATLDDEDVATITIRDRGSWREPAAGDGGRGLTIMRAAMDSVDVESGTEGTTVTLRRRLGRD
jgi:anti-sigma regulatory factor (Ser/Thr protein kinase)/putative methionine-R-sulfoxide reductase with GAF domain